MAVATVVARRHRVGYRDIMDRVGGRLVERYAFCWACGWTQPRQISGVYRDVDPEVITHRALPGIEISIVPEAF